MTKERYPKQQLDKNNKMVIRVCSNKKMNTNEAKLAAIFPLGKLVVLHLQKIAHASHEFFFETGSVSRDKSPLRCEVSTYGSEGMPVRFNHGSPKNFLINNNYSTIPQIHIHCV